MVRSCAGGSAAFHFATSSGVLVGASGAVFGLFIVSAAIKATGGGRSLIELAAIAPFVYEQITSNVSAQMSGSVGPISHAGHLGGAAAGLALVFLLASLPSDDA